MAYIVDRGRGLRLEEVVVIIRSRQQQARSCVILRDHSRYYTLTRPGTFRRYAESTATGLTQIGARARRRGRRPGTARGRMGEELRRGRYGECGKT